MDYSTSSAECDVQDLNSPFTSASSIDSDHVAQKLVPLSVNYHLTRSCNYTCGFCFHTALNSFVLDIDTAKRGLKKLRDAGMQKINFAGGEPFHPQRGRFLGELVKYCKKDLSLKVSIISNGSLITQTWIERYGDFVDVLGISIDSFDIQTNRSIGRFNRSVGREQVEIATRIREMCDQFQIPLKINTVVNDLNWEEDMSEMIRQLRPMRWKVFQVLAIEGENLGSSAKRDYPSFAITKDKFDYFVDLHRNALTAYGMSDIIVPEDNETMKDSYLLLDERMRFLNCVDGGKKQTESILDVDVETALMQSGFDFVAFKNRGGVYNWSREEYSK